MQGSIYHLVYKFRQGPCWNSSILLESSTIVYSIGIYIDFSIAIDFIWEITISSYQGTVIRMGLSNNWDSSVKQIDNVVPQGSTLGLQLFLSYVDDIALMSTAILAVMSSNGKYFSALLALCETNPSVTGGFSSQRPVTLSFDVLFDLRLIKRLSKQSRRRWFETSLWRQCVESGPY